MKVLMFGWEFPPYYSGGLGTVCHGMTQGLAEKGVEITFVMPKAPENTDSHVKIIGTNNLAKSIKLKEVRSILTPYMNVSAYHEAHSKVKVFGTKGTSLYGSNLFDEVNRYTEAAKIIADEEQFDVIHCHDWMTYRAGIEAKKRTNKPLVVHIHATEFDRTGGNGVNQHVYEIEKEGFFAADLILSVSNFTKNKLITHYGVPAGKIEVIHNAIGLEKMVYDNSAFKINKQDKLVLFLGRVTLQKGPEYFLEAAKKVLEKKPNVKFVMAGDGDMLTRMIERAAYLGISKNVLFTGFLTGEDINKMYKMADLYVMPSVSEPFGLTPLESLRNGTPVLISKTSGVAETLTNALKVDFWDINEMANKILAVLNYNSLSEALKENGTQELKKFNWNDTAQRIVDAYSKVASQTEPQNSKSDLILLTC